PELASVPAAEPPAVVMEPMPPVEEAALPAAEAPEAARWLPGWMRLDDGSARGGVDAAPVETSASAVLLASTAAPPPAPPAPRVVGLRVEQALPGTATPARTVFGLQRRFGCLWLKLPAARLRRPRDGARPGAGAGPPAPAEGKGRHPAVLPDLARTHADLPAVQVAQPADDGQADAGALRMAGMGAAVAAAEQPVGVLGAEPRPGIDHLHAAVDQAHQDLAGGGVLDRVADQVAQRHRQRGLRRLDHQVALAAFQPQRQRLAAQLRPVRFQQLLGDHRHVAAALAALVAR